MTALPNTKVKFPETELKARLTPQQYAVTQEQGTEPAYSGKYYKTKDPGRYACVVCGTKLFDSENKFDSNSGWPSFDQALPGAVRQRKDNSHGLQRVEVSCSSCGAHLGHVFPDGPKDSTGQRFCINSCALNLQDK